MLSCLIALQCQFVGNRAGGLGGAIASEDAAVLTLSESTFSNNEAGGKLNRGGDGGAVSSSTTDMLTISHCTFTKNRALTSGGAV